jgi:hypothetical protein
MPLPLNPNNEESIQEIIRQCDICISYGEFLEAKDEDYEYAENYLDRNN